MELLRGLRQFNKKTNRPTNQLGITTLLLLIGIAVVAGATWLTLRNKETDLSKSSVSFVEKIIQNETPKPTPFPFQELTLPYLREREYTSSLGELERLSQDSSYTSYLTSYDSDGFRVNGLLTIPSGDQPPDGFPAIVFLHGYIPPTLYRTTSNYAAYVDYLARRGYVVFKIDLRGHDQSEGEPMGGYYAGDYVIDTLNAYSALQNADFVNPAKIGLWGHSMSGNVTFRAFVAKQDIPALNIWAGAVYTYEDFGQFRISDNSYRPPTDDSVRRRYREELNQTYGDFDPESEFWKQVPATNYLDGVTGALQLNHAVDDEVVNIGYSRNLIDVLKGSEIVFELKEYPSGGHNISGSAFNAAMQNTVSFYDKYLK